jgi:hypothetical protein
MVILWDQITFKYYRSFSDIFRLLLVAFLEPIYYHLISIFFSVRGYISYFTQKTFEWGTMTRQGVESESKVNVKPTT